MFNWKLWGVITLIGLSVTLFGLHWYGKAREASVRGEILENAVSEAVQQRKADLKADASVASKNRVRLESARLAGAPARKVLSEKKDACADAAGDAEWGGVFNAALAGSREAVSTSRSLP